MRAAALVFLGGGLGSLLRYWAGIAAAERFGPFTPSAGWPWGTLLVNAGGCFVMGLCFRLLPATGDGPHDARLLVMTGLLGGFTTFSAFALESAQLWMREDGAGLALYLGLTLAFTLGGVAFGLALGQAFRS